jgi:predicted ATP-grasp superfamily ATP-dependent carboligase
MENDWPSMSRPSRKLAIVGASARAAAFSARRAGCEVVAADLFADADLQRIASVTRVKHYPDELPAWLAATDCDAWMYTGALENSPELIDRMAAIRPLIGIGGDSLRRVRNPFDLQRALGKARLLFPETRQSAAGLPRDGSWLRKTYSGASGSGVSPFQNDSQNQPAGLPAVFQRCVAGDAAAAIFILNGDGSSLWGVTRQLIGTHGARPWQYSGSVGPINLRPIIRAQLVAVGELLAQDFRLRGIVGVDVMIDSDQLWVIEVNPRYTASTEILERAATSPAVAAHVAACESHGGSEFAPKTPTSDLVSTKLIHAKAVLFAAQTTTISRGLYNWAMKEAWSDTICRPLADIPQTGEVIPAGHPVLTVFAAGDSLESCEDRLAARVAEVEARLYSRQIQFQT